MKRFKLHSDIPDRVWFGSYTDKKMHGPGELYELVETLGLVKRFVGTMHHDDMVQGSLYGVKQNRTGIFLEFDGDFSASGTGSVWDEHGVLLWSGQTTNRKPHGIGKGTVTHWGNTFEFEGTHVHESSYTGSLLCRLHEHGIPHSDLTYTGSLDKCGRPSGAGTWTFRGDFLDGHFTPTDAGLLFRGIARRKLRFLGQNVHLIAGALLIAEGVQVVNHGIHATFVTRGTRFFKFVEEYDKGDLIGTTDVYESDTNDPALFREDACLIGYGTLLGRYDDFADRITTFDSGGHKTFDGTGCLEFGQEPEFVRDGYGTVYVRGLPRFTSALFDRSVYHNVCELYDDDGKIMWALDDVNYVHPESTYMDSYKEWPYLNGFGKVFSKTGDELYSIRFDHSCPIGLKAVVALMKARDLNDDNFRDPITLDPIYRGRACLLVNENTSPMLVKSALAMWDTRPMTDPLRGSVPGYRFTKVRIVAP